MDSVAICAKKPKISFVGLPVLKPIKPITCSLSLLKLFSAVDMVNIKNPMIGVAAMYAFPTERFNQRKLLLPIGWVLVFCEAIFVPVILPAFITAIAVFAFFSAVLARLFLAPSMGKIALLSTKFTSAIFNSIRMDLKLFRAMFAALCNLSFFSHFNLLSMCEHYTPKYFEIACKRIEQAYAQGQLFAPEPVKQVQESLL